MRHAPSTTKSGRNWTRMLTLNAALIIVGVGGYFLYYKSERESALGDTYMRSLDQIVRRVELFAGNGRRIGSLLDCETEARCRRALEGLRDSPGLADVDLILIPASPGEARRSKACQEPRILPDDTGVVPETEFVKRESPFVTAEGGTLYMPAGLRKVWPEAGDAGAASEPSKPTEMELLAPGVPAEPQAAQEPSGRAAVNDSRPCTYLGVLGVALDDVLALPAASLPFDALFLADGRGRVLAWSAPGHRAPGAHPVDLISVSTERYGFPRVSNLLAAMDRSSARGGLPFGNGSSPAEEAVQGIATSTVSTIDVGDRRFRSFAQPIFVVEDLRDGTDETSKVPVRRTEYPLVLVGLVEDGRFQRAALLLGNMTLVSLLVLVVLLLASLPLLRLYLTDRHLSISRWFALSVIFGATTVLFVLCLLFLLWSQHRELHRDLRHFAAAASQDAATRVEERLRELTTLGATYHAVLTGELGGLATPDSSSPPEAWQRSSVRAVAAPAQGSPAADTTADDAGDAWRHLQAFTASAADAVGDRPDLAGAMDAAVARLRRSGYRPSDRLDARLEASVRGAPFATEAPEGRQAAEAMQAGTTPLPAAERSEVPAFLPSLWIEGFARRLATYADRLDRFAATDPSDREAVVQLVAADAALRVHLLALTTRGPGADDAGENPEPDPAEYRCVAVNEVLSLQLDEPRLLPFGFGLDAAGEEILAHRLGCRTTNPDPLRVRDRAYFGYWDDDPDRPAQIYVQRLVSYIDGSRSFAASFRWAGPTDGAEGGRCGAAPCPTVGVVVSEIQTLAERAVALARAEGGRAVRFALVDASGQVLFHTHDELAVVENWLRETDSPNELVALVSSPTRWRKGDEADAHWGAFEARYRGASVVGHVVPVLGSVAPQLSLVTYVPSADLEALLFYAAMVGLPFIVMLALLWALLFVIVTVLPGRRHDLVFPDPRRMSTYGYVAAGAVLGSLLWLVTTRFGLPGVPPLGSAVAGAPDTTVLLPIGTLLQGALLVVQPEKLFRRPPRWGAYPLQALAVAGVVGLALHDAGLTGPSALVGYVLLAGGGWVPLFTTAVLLFRSRSAASSSGGSSGMLARWRGALARRLGVAGLYVLMWLTLLMGLVVQGSTTYLALSDAWIEQAEREYAAIFSDLVTHELRETLRGQRERLRSGEPRRFGDAWADGVLARAAADDAWVDEGGARRPASVIGGAIGGVPAVNPATAMARLAIDRQYNRDIVGAAFRWLVVATVLLVSLWFALRLIAGRLFGLGTVFLSHLGSAPFSTRGSGREDAVLYVESLRDRPVRFEPEADVELRRVHDLDELKAAAADPPHLLVLQGFEADFVDPAARGELITQLEALVREPPAEPSTGEGGGSSAPASTQPPAGTLPPCRPAAARAPGSARAGARHPQLLVIAPILPTYWLTRHEDVERAGEDLTAAETARLAALLDRFRIIAGRPEHPLARVVEVQPPPEWDQRLRGLGIDQDVVTVLESELQRCPRVAYFIDPLIAELDQRMEAGRNRPREVDRPMVIQLLARAMNGEFLRFWSMSSPDEQAALVSIAEGGYPNFADVQTVQSLLQRGLIGKVNGRLDVRGEALRYFLATRSRARLEALQAERTRTGSWSAVLPSLIVLVALILAFLMASGTQVADLVAAGLAGLVALLPALNALMSLASRRSSAASASGG